jgi:hypothetical protein
VVAKETMFILADQRDSDVERAFARYTEYLKANSHRFPKSAYTLATSDWYFGFSSHQAPHDSWLESVQMGEPSSGERREVRTTSICIHLLGAYQDGFIEFHYPTVFEYRLVADTLGQGHGDWRYDEFRLDEKGRLVHEIEWAAFGAMNTWLIVASDVHHKWIPFAKAEQGDAGDERNVRG